MTYDANALIEYFRVGAQYGLMVGFVIWLAGYGISHIKKIFYHI